MKSFLKMLPAVLLVMTSVVGVSCTDRSPKAIVAPGNGGGQTNPGTGGNIPGIGGDQPYPNTGGETGGTFSTTLSKTQVMTLGFTSMVAMTYNIRFGGQNRSGNVEVGGAPGAETATITERNLPGGVTDTLVLELMQAGVLKARGERPGVSLIAGQPNNIQMTLSPVGGLPAPIPGVPNVPNIPGQPIGSTDLTISAIIGAAPPTTQPIAPNQPIVPPVAPQPIQPPVAPQPQNPGSPDLSVLGNWDGRQHQGNDRWTICTVGTPGCP